MAINLLPYSAIKTALFCEMDISGYTVLKMTDYNTAVLVNETTFTALGDLLAVTETTSDLKASNADVTVTISGIPTANMTDFLTKKIKGSKITVWRGVFEPTSDELLDIPDNPVGKFFGFINNFTVDETWDEGSKSSTTTITLGCKSAIGLLQYKTTGRRTNPLDMKQFYPGDTSFDRVPGLAGAKIHFGAK